MEESLQQRAAQLTDGAGYGEFSSEKGLKLIGGLLTHHDIFRGWGIFVKQIMYNLAFVGKTFIFL